MSVVRCKLFYGENVSDLVGKVNEFLESSEVSYVDVKEIYKGGLILIYKRKKDLGVIDKGSFPRPEAHVKAIWE